MSFDTQNCVILVKPNVSILLKVEHPALSARGPEAAPASCGRPTWPTQKPHGDGVVCSQCCVFLDLAGGPLASVTPG